MWYLTQVRSRCSTLTKGPELAELLSTLELDDIAQIMNEENFNKAFLQDTILWCMNRIEQNIKITEAKNLLKASVDKLLEEVSQLVEKLPGDHQVFNIEGRESTEDEITYLTNIKNILKGDDVHTNLNDLIPSVTYYLRSLLLSRPPGLPEDKLECLIRFMTFSMESLNYCLDTNNINVHNFDFILQCVSQVVNNNNLANTLGSDQNNSKLCSCINSIFKLVNYFLQREEPLPLLEKGGLKETLDDIKTLPAGHACHQLSTLFAWFIQSSDCKIPKFLLSSIKKIIIGLGRLTPVNSYILLPPGAWRNGWEVSLFGKYKTLVPPLPIKFLQEIEVLEEFVSRIALLGWTTRQQFEETWMCLLSVLSLSQNDYSDTEEINAITHASSLAVQAITSLLIESLYIPQPGNRNVSTLIHVPRDLQIEQKNARYNYCSLLILVYINIYINIL